jgi:hypothetical protein
MRARGAVSILCAALAVCLGAPPSSANGRFPAAQHVLVGPGAESRIIALRVTFGFLVSDDGGATFHWICENALDYPTSPFDPGYAVDPSGALHIGLLDGLMRVSSDRCDFAREPVAPGRYLIDLDQSVDGRTIVAVSSDNASGVTNRVFRSDDSGASFRALGDGLAGVLFETLEMAPTDTQRVYLTAVVEGAPRRVAFYRSDDGGNT